MMSLPFDAALPPYSCMKQKDGIGSYLAGSAVTVLNSVVQQQTLIAVRQLLFYILPTMMT